MANDTQILRQYLLSLGFHIDAIGAKRFDSTVEGFDKSIKGLGVGLIAATGALATLVSSAANSMEKLYYASRRAGTSVGTLQAMRYGAGQIGVDAETLTGIIDNFGMMLRRNPGLTGLLKQLGVTVSGDKGKDFQALIEKLSALPFPIAASFAETFGIDDKTLFQLEEFMPKYKAAMELRRQMSEEAGIDDDKAAEALLRYNNKLDELKERLVVLRNVSAVALEPLFDKSMDKLTDVVKWLSKDIGDNAKAFDPTGRPNDNRFTATAPGLTGKVGMLWRAIGQYSTFDFAGAKETIRQLAEMEGKQKPFVGPAVPDNLGQATGMDRLFETWNRAAGLPPGVLKKMSGVESSGDPMAVSKRGALGLMQFLPGTAERFHVNPWDPGSSVQGASQYMKLLLHEFGSLPLALAAYNTGEGHIRKYLRGQYDLVPETTDYVKSISGVSLTPHVTINVNGAGDPAKVAQEVARVQAQVPADIVRNMKGAHK